MIKKNQKKSNWTKKDKKDKNDKKEKKKQKEQKLSMTRTDQNDQKWPKKNWRNHFLLHFIISTHWTLNHEDRAGHFSTDIRGISSKGVRNSRLFCNQYLFIFMTIIMSKQLLCINNPISPTVKAMRFTSLLLLLPTLALAYRPLQPQVHSKAAMEK